jgi:hypothetical protein
VPAAFASLLQVVVAVGPFADDAVLDGQAEDPPQASAVALGTVEVAGASTAGCADLLALGRPASVGGRGRPRQARPAAA